MIAHKIARYEIREEIGRGGMATVFRAFDPHFQRDVALKVIPREFLHDPSFRIRFQREAKTIAVLEHPAIVPVYDVGEEEGQPFLVMRYLPGGSLGDRLKQGQLPFAEVTRIVERLAPALDEAHKLGIIHRDLKPDNILFDQRNNPFLTDFGIAKLTEERTNLTTGGLIIGTPAYMSPEQANGEKIDGRSDIYALGVIVFQMLTGQLPFEASTPLGIIMKHITQPVPQILDVEPDLPPGCNLIIQKTLAKNPTDRFGSAAALAEALRQAPTLSPDMLLQAKKKRTKSKIRRLDSKEIATKTDEIKTDSPVICPKCNTQNIGQRRLCISCGNRLTLECPLCFHQNQVDAVMCTKCGTNLQQLKSQQRVIQQTRKDSLAKRDQALRAKLAQQLREKVMVLLEDIRYRRSRTAALHKLDQLIEPTIKTLGGHLMDPDDTEAQCQSAMVLGKLYERPEIDMAVKSQIVGVLIDALDAPNQEVRLQVEQMLEDFGNRRSREISNIFKGLVGWIKGD
ncbi:MAG: protein kinase [Anaerolineae bacterium]|nr:protein kinase [Anaerolineae bacterium]